jgi:hypothetical protein
MTNESQKAGAVAVIAAVAGIAAVIGILVWAGQDDPARPEPTLTATRGFPEADEPRYGAVTSAPPTMPPRRTDAGVGSGLDGAVALPRVPILGERASADIVPSGRAEDLRWPPPSAELTPERRYEATAFVADLIIVRLDQMRTELEEARAAGDAVRIRRLEANLAVLAEESARLNGIARGLERDLGRTGAAPAAPAEDLPLEE